MRINNITISYDGKRIFSNFSADISDKTVCIWGASGKGKTTLLKAIAGIVKLDDGEITDRPQKPSFMFQDDRLFPWLTVRDNVRAVLSKAYYDKADYYLEKMELYSVKDEYPSKLSGGMCRRVALARTLAYGGDLILLDEPFRGLDMPLIERIAPIISEMPQNIIMSTHSEREIEIMGAKVIEI